MDLSNPIVQVGILSLTGVIVSALLSALITIYLKRRDIEATNTKTREEILKDKAHEGLEEAALFVHAIGKAREDIREEYETILKDDRVRLAATESLLEQQGVHLTNCQENHKESIKAIEGLHGQLEKITARLVKHELLAKQDETYIKQLQEDLAKAGITVRVRVYKNDQTI